MLYYTSGQELVLAVMLLAGAVAGVWYGLIRRAARLMQAGPWLNALLDVFAAMGVCAILTAALLAANYGEARVYALAAAAAGFALERATLGWLVGRVVGQMKSPMARAAKALEKNRLIKKIFR